MPIKTLLKNIRVVREKAGLTEAHLEERLILGPGWISRFENAEIIPSIDMVLAILRETNASLADLLKDLPELKAATVERYIFAEQSGKDITVHFRYAKFEAQYTLPNSTIGEFEVIIKTLRDGLASLAAGTTNGGQGEAIKTESVVRAFITAVQLWPHANASDIWGFILSRAYCDPYNHPAQFARLDFAQSWKRTGGWALEEILVRHYGPFLKQHGVNLFIADGVTKQRLVQNFVLTDRVVADKVDVLLTGDTSSDQTVFGVVHVKASIAERRTDDEPLSAALTKAGYTSPLWTMDCKSMPGSHPRNRGELGKAEGKISDKRGDIEVKGSFTGCFSYNKNTIPTSEKSNLPPEKRVHVCDFKSVDDTFSRFIISRWQSFRKF